MVDVVYRSGLGTTFITLLSCIDKNKREIKRIHKGWVLDPILISYGAKTEELDKS